jgi:hypothetical protein
MHRRMYGPLVFCHHRRYLSDAARVNSVSPPNQLVSWHRLKDHHGRIVLQRDDDDALWPGSSFVEATMMFASTQAGHAPIRQKQGPDHRWIISQHNGVSVHLHRWVGPQCDRIRIWSRTDHKPCGSVMHTHTGESWSNVTEVRTLSRMDDKPKQRCSEHPSRSQIATVMAMTITADILLPWPKSDCDRSYVWLWKVRV